MAWEAKGRAFWEGEASEVRRWSRGDTCPASRWDDRGPVTGPTGYAGSSRRLNVEGTGSVEDAADHWQGIPENTGDSPNHWRRVRTGGTAGNTQSIRRRRAQQSPLLKGGHWMAISMRVVQVGSWRRWWVCESVGVKQRSLDTVKSASSKCTAPAVPRFPRHQGLTPTWWRLLVHPCMHAHRFSRVLLFETLWTIAHQAPLSMGFSRQEYWSGLPCPLPGDLPDPGIESVSLMSPALIGRFFTTGATWEAPFEHSSRMLLFLSFKISPYAMSPC